MEAGRWEAESGCWSILISRVGIQETEALCSLEGLDNVIEFSNSHRSMSRILNFLLGRFSAHYVGHAPHLLLLLFG